jgi:ChrR Cupin-like domain
MARGVPGPERSAQTGRAAQEFHEPTGHWVHPDGAAAGVTELVLSEDLATGDRSVLQRYEPGVDGSPGGVIRHPYVEEVYLLEGTLTDLTMGATFGAGSYAYRPAGMPHGPYATREGCLVLVVVRRS